jgi:hypothetical protein
MQLPKKLFSYSQWSLWQKSKESYRKRYYEGAPSFETRETIFGKNVAEMLEKSEIHPILSKVPRGTHPEYEIKTVISEIPILAFLDSYTYSTNSIFEYKTGRIPWTQERVNEHEQLPFYAACVKAKYGAYDPHILLTWLETSLEGRTELIDGIMFHTDDNRDKKIELTGRIAVFTRVITDKEIARIEESIRATAEEISKDYEEYLNTPSTQPIFV